MFDELSLSFEENPGIESIQLFNTRGALQTEFHFIADENRPVYNLNLRKLTRGTYLIVIRSAKGVFSGKIIKTVN